MGFVAYTSHRAYLQKQSARVSINVSLQPRIVMEVLQNGLPEPVDFTPCSICGRTFNPEVLTRHERVCAKNQRTRNKRPVFDTSKKRIEGTDLQAFFAMRPDLKTKKPSTAEIKASEKKKNWRRKHEDFINSIRSAKEYTDAELTGSSVPPPRPSLPNPDYLQCPYCERRFEQYSAERHIPFCKEKHTRLGGRNGQGNKAMEKLNKRIQYKPPTLKKKSSSTSAEQQDNTPAKKSSQTNPPGYHLVAKKTNFSGTYSLDTDDTNYLDNHSSSYQSPYSVKRIMSQQRTSGGQIVKVKSQGRVTNVPATHTNPISTSASDPVIRQQHNSDMRREMSDERLIRRRRSQLKTPQSVVSGLTNRHRFDRQRGEEREGGGVGLARQIRGVTENDGEHYSSSSSLGDRDGPRLMPVKPKGKSKRGLRVREDSPSSHDEIRYDSQYYNGSNMGRDEEPSRVDSGTSLGSRKLSGAPLNQHGMTMGKFCYECGAKYPVPQAKYCCECGTKRI